MKTTYAKAVLYLIAPVIVLALTADSAASEEEMVQPRKVGVWAEARGFGEIEAAIESSREGDRLRVASLVLQINGEEVSIPADAYQDLTDPLLYTFEVRTERGYDEHPWLYLTFDIARRDDDGAWNPAKVYIAFQDGLIRHRAIRTRVAANRWEWQQTELAE